MRTSKANLVFTIKDEHLKKDVASVILKYSYVKNKRFDVVEIALKRLIQDLVLSYKWEYDIDEVEVNLKRKPKLIGGVTGSDQALRDATWIATAPEDEEKGGD